MNIIDCLEKNARLYPDRTAYVEIRPVSKTRRETSWSAFHERTNRLANALRDKGIGEGNSVMMLGKNSMHWLECYFAVLKTGAWIIPLNFRFTDEEILFCAGATEPAVFIFEEEYGSRIEKIRASMSSVRRLICMGKGAFASAEDLDSIIEEGSPDALEAPSDDQAPCALYFTSGTTGRPKPVQITRAGLFCTAITECVNNRLNENDSLLMMPPLYHLAIGHLLGMLAAGGKTVLLTEKITPQFIFESMAQEKISYLFLLVPWALDLLEALERKKLLLENYDLSGWRFAQLGAQPVPASIVERIKAFFPNMRFDTTYGLSESTGPGVVHLGMDNEHKLGALGKESATWSVRIVGMDGEDVETGQVGEIIAKGNGVMAGYYQNPDLTARTIVGGWLYTGDLGRRDEDGFIFLVDRKKDLVICGGENIYPAEVERILLRHPKIFDVAVIGTPDERLGEIVTAVIQTASGDSLSEEEVLSFCEENLARYKRPRSIIFDTVPRSPTGKVEKPKLRDKYC